MIKIANRTPVMILLVFFSYLIAFCGIGSGVFWALFKGKDMSSLIYGSMILAGSLLAASLVRMFADIGQMIFDLKPELQNSFRQAKELNRDLRNQLQLQNDALKQGLQAIAQKLEQSSHEAQELDKRLNQDLRNQLQLQNDALKQGLQAIAKEFAAIKNNFDLMNCDSRDMNQNIRQIRDFFGQIEKHLDLKK